MHEKSCKFIADAEGGGTLVECGFCNKDVLVPSNCPPMKTDESSPVKCPSCDKPLIYPDGADW